MRKHRVIGRKVGCSIFLTAALIMSIAVSGCGNKTSQTNNDPKQGQESDINTVKTETGENNKTDTSETDKNGNSESGENTQNANSSDLDESKVSVSSVEELLNAIAPGKTITVEPGKYDLTTYLGNDLYSQDIQNWNSDHKYVKIRDVYDGLEVVVQDVEDLTIEGGSEKASDTEIVTEPRYACIFFFNNAKNLAIRNITMGHTDVGECVGNVIDLNFCKNVNINNADLYGCGVYGLGVKTGTGEVYVSDTTIRECSSGPFEISGANGEIVFENCNLVDSYWGGYFDENANTTLFFKGCRFGQMESNEWADRGELCDENCSFMEVSEYPEYGYGDEIDIPLFDPENMEQVTLDNLDFTYLYFTAHAKVDTTNGNTEYFNPAGGDDNIYLDFLDEGNVYLYTGSETFAYTFDGSDINQGCLKSEDGNLYFNLYTNEDGVFWLAVQLNNDLIWLYII